MGGYLSIMIQMTVFSTEKGVCCSFPTRIGPSATIVAKKGVQGMLKSRRIANRNGGRRPRSDRAQYIGEGHCDIVPEDSAFTFLAGNEGRSPWGLNSEVNHRAAYLDHGHKMLSPMTRLSFFFREMTSICLILCEKGVYFTSPNNAIRIVSFQFAKCRTTP